MEILVLASGSSGNTALITAGETSVLVDVGVTAKQVRVRLAEFGRDEKDVGAIVISHEHSDHIRGLEVFLKRQQIPVWATHGTWAGLTCRAEHGGELVSGRTIDLGELRVTPVATSHDAREPVAFLFDDGEHRVAMCTDTGIFTPLLEQRFQHCNLLLVETNHDPDMLRHGAYPWPLKQRIASRLGHLANSQSEDAVGRVCSRDLRAVVGVHLSSENNSPLLVEQSFAACCPSGVVHAVAPRTEMLSIMLENSTTAIERKPVPATKRRGA